MQVVPSAKDLKVVAVRYQSLCNIVNFFRLLALSSPLAKNDIGFNVSTNALRVAFETDKASFFGVLQVVAVALGDFTVNCLLDPHDFIDQFVSMLLHNFKRKPVFGVNDPDEQKSVRLQLVKRYIENLVVI